MVNEFPLIRQKISLNWSSYFQDLEMPYSFDVVIHGVPLCFNLANKEIVEELKVFFPKEWQTSHEDSIKVSWREPIEAMTNGQEWDDIVDPNCHFQGDFVSQRDFLTKKQNSYKYELITPCKIDDGFFNFLRFLLPLSLLSKNKILFHSSCVISDEKEAFVFFGPSGAGKTTISKICQDQGGNVLGDDMNLLSFNKDQVFVEAATVGQRIYNKDNFGVQYPVKKVFWLKQTRGFENSLIEEGKIKYFLSSFANLFWNQLDQNLYGRVFSFASIMNKNIRLYELGFKKEKEVWSYVKNIKR